MFTVTGTCSFFKLMYRNLPAIFYLIVFIIFFIVCKKQKFPMFVHRTVNIIVAYSIIINIMKRLISRNASRTNMACNYNLTKLTQGRRKLSKKNLISCSSFPKIFSLLINTGMNKNLVLGFIKTWH